MSSDFYYPDELTDEDDIINATETEITREKRQEILNKRQTKMTNQHEEVNNQHEEVNEDEEFVKFISAQRSKNTVSKTKCDVNNFTKYCSSLNENRQLQDIPVKDMNTLLCKFFMNVVRNDGEQYEPDTISSIQRSIQRYLQELGVQYNILKDNEFVRSREVIAAKRKSLVSEGKGNKPNATRALTTDEEDKLFSVGYFGDHEPLVLQRTLWWVLSMNFGFRARDESHKLRWGDVELTEDPDTGNEVLAWLAERGSKTRHGKENGHRRAFTPTVQANNTIKCPVKLWKKFQSHRPKQMNEAQSPFFLAINHNRPTDSPVWFKNCPLGKNQIGMFLSKAVECGHLSGFKKVANHSVRKTSIGRLLDANVPETFVAQLSGHKSLSSLGHYKVPSAKHQRAMSSVLSTQNMGNYEQNLPSSSESFGQTQDVKTTQARQVSRLDARSSTASSSLASLTPMLQRAEQHNNALSFNPNEIFRGSTIGNITGCSFNFYNSAAPSTSTATCTEVRSPPPKRRRAYFLDSDSE